MQNNHRSSDHKGGGAKKFYFSRKKYCTFCKDKIKVIDFKNARVLEKYTLETGKIFPGRVTGTCAYHQKQLSIAIKRARHMAMLKFVEPKRG